MGQRLVFKCMKDDKCFATLYYHWSAYTMSVYAEGCDIVKGLKSRNWTKDMSVKETIAILLDVLESNISDFDADCHGGVSGGTDSAEWKALIEMGITPHEGEHVDRTYGLLDVTEEGMKNALDWAEDIEEINFDECYFTNGCFIVFDMNDKYEHDDLAEICENYGDIDKMDIPDLPEIFRNTIIPFDKAEETQELARKYYDKFILGKLGTEIYTSIA